MISASSSGLAAKTYFHGDEALSITPNYIITPTLAIERCPLTYSYYLLNTDTHEWEL